MAALLPRLVQSLCKPVRGRVPTTSSALGTKPRRGARAGQHNALSPLHLTAAPHIPFVTPFPRTPQQTLPCSSSSPKEDQARRGPACSVAVAGWPGPFLCQKRLFYGELLFWICDFSNLSFHVSRHEGMLRTGHAMSCAVIAFGFRPRMVQAPQVSCPPALSRHKPFLIREKLSVGLLSHQQALLQPPGLWFCCDYSSV